jgi:hypothetical protein
MAILRSATFFETTTARPIATQSFPSTRQDRTSVFGLGLVSVSTRRNPGEGGRSWSRNPRVHSAGRRERLLGRVATAATVLAAFIAVLVQSIGDSHPL